MNTSSEYEARRFQDQEATARRRAEQKGHTLGQFEFEQGWYAAVSTCTGCGLLAAIDLTERPYLFGLAFRRECRAQGAAA